MIFNKDMFIRPKNELEGGAKKKSGTECPGCKGLYNKDELDENLYVCPRCGYHFKMPARKRILNLVDEGSFLETDEELISTDVLLFPGYIKKLETAKQKSGEKESVVTGIGMLNGVKCAVFAMEAEFMMGSMGRVTGEKITRLFEQAEKERIPVIGFCLSGGARMQEGILSLMQMAKVSGAVKKHGDAGLLYIAVLQNPTTGGVTASFAMEGDIIIAEKGALVAFAGPRVIEQTLRQKLPKGFQSAEFVQEKGFIDIISDRRELKALLAKILKMHAERGAL